ncbi:SDR family oxidoreductase [Enterobacter kobei]|uniref:SDR family oxidoreductase n=1 Tax=Enterobacter kobei TaxID=208224 RepID=UPI003A986E42
MNNKNVLITGANKSIGFETARELGLLGYKVWLGSRDNDRGKSAVDSLTKEGIDAQLIIIDVTSTRSIEEAAQRIQREDGKLDVLINNAGILGAHDVAPGEQPVDDIMTVYDTNVFGLIRVTQAFIPLLKCAPNARIIMVSSGLGSLEWVSDVNHPYSRVQAMGYTSSKTAVNAITVAFANALKVEGISINAVDPGYTATDFNGHTGYRTVAEAARGIVWLAEEAKSDMTAGFYFDQNRAPW